VISLNLVLAGLRLGLKNRQVGEKWDLAPSRYIMQNPRVGGNYLNGVAYLNFLNHLPQSNDGHGAEQSFNI
jgi:hypothetical protein